MRRFSYRILSCVRLSVKKFGQMVSSMQRIYYLYIPKSLMPRYALAMDEDKLKQKSIIIKRIDNEKVIFDRSYIACRHY